MRQVLGGELVDGGHADGPDRRRVAVQQHPQRLRLAVAVHDEQRPVVPRERQQAVEVGVVLPPSGHGCTLWSDPPRPVDGPAWAPTPRTCLHSGCARPSLPGGGALRAPADDRRARPQQPPGRGALRGRARVLRRWSGRRPARAGAPCPPLRGGRQHGGAARGPGRWRVAARRALPRRPVDAGRGVPARAPRAPRRAGRPADDLRRPGGRRPQQLAALPAAVAVDHAAVPDRHHAAHPADPVADLRAERRRQLARLHHRQPVHRAPVGALGPACRGPAQRGRPGALDPRARWGRAAVVRPPRAGEGPAPGDRRGRGGRPAPAPGGAGARPRLLRRADRAAPGPRRHLARPPGRPRPWPGRWAGPTPSS